MQTNRTFIQVTEHHTIEQVVLEDEEIRFDPSGRDGYFKAIPKPGARVVVNMHHFADQDG